MKKLLFGLIVFSILLTSRAFSQEKSYLWIAGYDTTRTISRHIPVPDGYARVKPIKGSFAYWLQNLPLKEDGAKVHFYNGKEKPNQSGNYAVLDIDTGDRDLQQCADAVIRLRAEYLYGLHEFAQIHFKFTSGHNAKYEDWIQGFRPVVDQVRVNWEKLAGPDSSYEGFREYLDSVFMYAGSYSLANELKPVEDIGKMRIGDVFIQAGFPGHALIVVDMATDKSSGKSIFMLAQGYTPAQDIHVLTNPDDRKLSPWYSLDFGDTLHTPDWTFKKTDLKRF
jgi:hypothetical protein